MTRKRVVTIACAAAALAAFALATPAEAGKPWHSVLADSDYTNECSTILTSGASAAAPGGTSCYTATFFVPGSANVLRIRYSGQGDTHGGEALELGCVITDQFGTRFCNPPKTGPAAPSTYLTKSKLPTVPAVDADLFGNPNNCNDGGGGSADCHDNAVEHTWCVPIVGDDIFTVDWRIASKGGTALVFIEASEFYVDSTKVDGQCDFNGVQD